MSRAKHPRIRCGLMLSAILGGLACALPPPTEDVTAAEVYASSMARRLAGLQVGQTRNEARLRLGNSRVRMPKHQGESYASPLHSLSLVTPEGRRVVIDVYVVSAVRAEGCPDVHTELAPVVYVDDRVAATDWDFVEAHWRRWGGELAVLRAARGVHGCVYEAPRS